MEKNERIEQIKRTLWLMEYKDHWTPADWTERARLNRELNELRGD